MENSWIEIAEWLLNNIRRTKIKKNKYEANNSVGVLTDPFSLHPTTTTSIARAQEKKANNPS